MRRSTVGNCSPRRKNPNALLQSLQVPASLQARHVLDMFARSHADSNASVKRKLVIYDHSSGPISTGGRRQSRLLLLDIKDTRRKAWAE